MIIHHKTQIPNPGDALVHDWMGLPLITMRDQAGNIGTFMNVCRHRGMRSGANSHLLFGGLEEAAVRFHKIIQRELESY